MTDRNFILDMQGWCAYWHASDRRSYERGDLAECVAVQRIGARAHDDLRHEIERQAREVAS